MFYTLYSSGTSDTICAGPNRIRIVYTSLTEVIEVRVVSPRDGQRFMLKYEGIWSNK